MKKCFFFTKTNWDEQPRIRHQLALLLRNYDHQIVFFEKPKNLFLNKDNKHTKSDRNLKFFRTTELLHHKLRINFLLRDINARWERSRIAKIINDFSISGDDVVINFNYDYSFLRGLFPNNKIITVINDDFWCRALLGYEKPLRDVLRETCQNSDVVLAVSEPLIKQLARFCDPKLLLPWSDASYSDAKATSKRTSLLFWGYINNRLNYGYLLRLADALHSEHPQFSIDFIGPVDESVDRRFYELIRRPNVTLSDPCDLKNLNFERTLAAFIPYVTQSSTDAITLSNKALRLLANGLPLLITGMPNFLKASFVLRAGKTIAEDLELIASLPEIFSRVQPSIRNFVNQNTGQERYEQLKSYLN